MIQRTGRQSIVETLLRLSGAFVVAFTTVTAAGIASAQQATGGPSGHWTGTIAAEPAIPVEVDLALKGDVWYGTISIPSQGTKGIPLVDVAVKGNAIRFGIPGAPGDPRFAGTLSPDGKTISGDFTQGGGTVPLTLSWKSEPKFEVPQKSTPITKDLEGAWEGPLDVNGKVLRLRVQLANGPDGATGKLISLDQGNVEITIATITQDGARLKLLITMISGAFDGELKGDELTGTWTQGPLSLPLVLKRAAK
jgi:hypothetical protein